MKFNKKISFAILLVSSLIVLCSISAVSADSYGPNGFDVSNGGADAFTQLTANKNIYPTENMKVPKRYKEYENSTFQVAKGSKISYKAAVNTNGDFLVNNLKGTKVKSATINFGVGSTKKGTGWISQTYKKKGWYLIKVNINATCTAYDYFGNPINATGNITNGTKYYLVYVANKPQLSLSKVSITAKSQKDVNAYKKKGNINYLSIKVTNVGSVTTKATKIKMWYQDGNKTGKVHPKLKKFTVSAKVKSLKPGKSDNVIINFKIPKKYANYVKNLKLDSANKNKNQMSKAFNLYSFI